MSPLFKRRCFPNLLAIFVFAAGCSQSPKLDLDQTGVAIRPQSLTKIPKQVWEVRLQTPPSAILPLDSQRLLITSHRGEVYTFDLDRGKRDSPVWQILRKEITARLIDATAQQLYIASAWEQQLRAYDVERGKLIWKRKIPGIIGTMALTDEQLLTASLTGKITAHDTRNGRTIWERKLPGRIQHGIQLTDSLAIVLTDRGTLYAFAAGSVHRPIQANEPYPFLWKRDLPVNPDAQYVAGNGYLYIVDSQGQVLCIDGSNGADVFQSNLGAPVYSPPLVIPDLILVATADGKVIALRADDGSQIWAIQGSGLIKHPLLMAGTSSIRHILAVFARGELLALEASTGEELWRLETGGPITIAALTPDGVVVVNRRNQLRRYRISGTGQQHRR
ncbi:PQQ-binding-like beta-propeller repeat protein [Candidatus Neomarinimicrobiota bacterium]